MRDSWERKRTVERRMNAPERARWPLNACLRARSEENGDELCCVNFICATRASREQPRTAERAARTAETTHALASQIQICHRDLPDSALSRRPRWQTTSSSSSRAGCRRSSAGTSSRPSSRKAGRQNATGVRRSVPTLILVLISDPGTAPTGRRTRSSQPSLCTT